MSIDDLTVYVFSHASYSDVWPLFFGQYRRHLGYTFRTILATSGGYGSTYLNRVGDTVAVYDDKLMFNDKCEQTISLCKTKYVLWLQEDHILYDSVNIDAFAYILSLLDKYSDMDFCRLVRSGNYIIDDGAKFMHKIDAGTSYVFCMQPTIWRTESLLRIYRNVKAKSIWCEQEINKQCIQMGINGMFWYDGEPQRGSFHYDSKLFPCTCTGIVKGRWNMKEYKLELLPLLDAYGIDENARGTNEQSA